jgi:tryptophan synthase alpha chain
MDAAAPGISSPPSSTPPSSTLIARRFSALREQERCALMPFLMAGDPDLSTTRAALLALQHSGADLIELGIPYSDPLADGPVIQAAAGRALAAGTTPGAVLAMLADLRGALTTPVVLFTYSNPLLNRGMDSFCREAAAAGAAGLVVPDLPLEEAEKLSAIAASHGLDLVLLVAPTTPPERMGRIHRASRGFTYLVSVTGVTGVRSRLEARVEPLVRQLQELGSTPVAVGFGIAGVEQAREVRRWGADGAIVGSALVKTMAAAVAAGEDGAAAAGAFCRELRQGLDDQAMTMSEQPDGVSSSQASPGEPPLGSAADADQRELERLFAFLGRIQAEPELREQINWMQTALEVSELAAAEGQPFRPETLIALLQRAQEAPSSRVGLMDEKLIRIYLRRDSLL